MKTLKELCIPRESVFAEGERSDALDLSDLKEGKIDAKAFFEETYMTQGLELVLDSAFSRFKKKSDVGIIRLTQSMGGGKTHTMVALGLLAKEPVLRYKLFGDKYGDVNNVRIVAYTGRENDIKYGIWGEIAEQLGKREMFSNYYAPLDAPGQSAWINLLKSDTPTLILLDELPPYFEYATSRQIGGTTLATLTVTALANLFVAIGKEELNNVFLVISDLRNTYEGGSAAVGKALSNLDNEVKRIAKQIEPVNSTNDELYNILKHKCFSSFPTEEDENIIDVAKGFKDEVSRARQSGVTSTSPDTIYRGVVESYPFHPCIKDLFARFKDNTNFQQTRGCIRLARNMVRCLWNSGEAEKKYIINGCDIDLRDPETYSTIRDIKPKLDKAIAHDIVSSNGQAMAELCDENTGLHATEELCKMLLMSSLSEIQTAILGLSEAELAGFMVGPGNSFSNLKNTLENFRSKAWYLYNDKNGRLYFKDLKNVNAELATMRNSYDDETAKQYVRGLLEKQFAPKVKDVYQEVLVFPGIDQIDLSKDKVSLILYEPNTDGGGLQKDLATWYENETFKNRVCFLTGSRNGMQSLMDAAKECKAIDSIIKRMEEEDKVSPNDPQYQAAIQIRDRVKLSLCSALKEIFVTLYYPSRTGIKSAEIQMEFGNNNFNPEEQIRNLLADVTHKFIRDPSADDMFKMKIETRLFTRPKMLWIEIEQRAAENPEWNWCHPSALKNAKALYIQQGYWIESNGMVDRDPPKPKTSVVVRTLYISDDGEATLSITMKNGTEVHYEIGQNATSASMKINPTELSQFKTKELVLHFLCIDTKGEHETGENAVWTASVDCRYDLYDMHGKKMVRLVATNSNTEIRYTTDGSDPKGASAAVYNEPFEWKPDYRLLLAVAHNQKYGIWGNVLSKLISTADPNKIEIDEKKPLSLYNANLSTGSTRESIDFVRSLKKVGAKISNFGIDILTPGGDMNEWFNFSGGTRPIDMDHLEDVYESIFKIYGDQEKYDLTIKVPTIDFESGRSFLDWIADRKEEVKNYKDKINQ